MGTRRNRVTMMGAGVANGYGDVCEPANAHMTFQATGFTTAGTGTATIEFYGSNVESPSLGADVDWVLLGTVSLTLGMTATGGGFAINAPWAHVRPKLSNLTGTGASVNAYMNS